METRPNKNTFLVWLCLTCCDQTLKKKKKNQSRKTMNVSLLFYSETEIDLSLLDILPGPRLLSPEAT